MKIATLKDGSRDGQLVVVSRDLSLAHYASGVVGRMQQLLDDWNFLSPQLEELSQTLNHGKARHAFAFDPAMCLAPLPRAACVAMVDPPVMQRERHPLQLAVLRGDALLGARETPPVAARNDGAAELPEPPVGLDFCGQLALITGELAAGSAADDALAAIRLVMLACSWHRPEADEAMRASPWASISFAPVAVTPDELGAAWSNGRIELPIDVMRGNKRFGRCPSAGDTGWSIGELLAAGASHDGLRNGTLLGLGTPAGDGSVGDIAIASRRQRERELDGAPRTPYLEPGEALRIDAIGRDGSSVFGAIEPATAAHA
ncbi:fumarylacetoacetate hydrolase family protein [Piscinibacter sakaiensis]|uniref:fumarylacetoacetate hydrolase family protein n=1 Tax=Piscinibacter sakaiensis TaxID=1547922 RepID=UPI003AABC4A7